MAIFPEIPAGAAAARDLIVQRFPGQPIDVRGDEAPIFRQPATSLMGMVDEMSLNQWRVVCTALDNGINVGAMGRYGFSISEWGGPHIPGYVMVKYPSSPLTEDQVGFREALAAVLVPVVESALAAIQAEREAVSRG